MPQSMMYRLCIALSLVLLALSLTACHGDRDRRNRGPVSIGDGDAGFSDVGEADTDPTVSDPNCDPGQTFCDESCVGTNTNPLHCGGCGRACAIGELCVSGTCTAQEGDCPQFACTGFTFCEEVTGNCLPGCERDTQCTGGQICNTSARVCECPTGTHSCGGRCVSNDDVATCGDRCTPCPSATGGTAVCVNGTCELECDDGYRNCGGTCASCPSDATETVCEGNQCVADACPSGQRLCEGQCSTCPTQFVVETECRGAQCVAADCEYFGEISYGACGTGCVSCPAYTWIYQCTADDQCWPVECAEGYQACTGTCVDNTSVDHCGTRCTPCPTSANGTATCDGTSCGFDCSAGARPCSTGCCLWSVENVDNREGAGDISSIAIDSNGNPWIAYLNDVTGNLDIAFWTSLNWSLSTLAATNYSTFPYTYNRPHIAIGPNHTVAVAFVDATAADLALRVALWTGASWQISFVDTIGNTGMPHVAFDAAGNPVVFYHRIRSGTRGTAYAYFDGSTWVTESVQTDIGSLGGRTSMVMGPDGQPRAAYLDATTESLRYAVRTAAGNWSTEHVGPGGYSTSIAIKSDGQPAIAYTTISPGTLRYAQRSASGNWSSSEIVTGSSTSVALRFDPSGVGHVAFIDSTALRIRYGRQTATGWDVQTISTPEDVYNLSMALDGAGDVRISFDSGEGLKMLR